MHESTLTVEPESKTALTAGIEDVRAMPLGRLARQDVATWLGRVLPGLGTLRVATCTFQSSI
jgi:hypothetical protein